MSNASGVGGHTKGFGATLRTDNWWIGPAFTAGAFATWLLYYFWAAFQNVYYSAGPYVSPFYILVERSEPGELASNHFLLPLPGLPAFIPASPALLLGAMPGMFRMTCYYYRKAYYRTFFGTPPGCAVGPVPQADYRGETFLLIFQNLHRYTLYIAIALLPILWATLCRLARAACAEAQPVARADIDFFGKLETQAHLVAAHSLG